MTTLFLTLIACRDSPAEVVEGASEAASSGQLPEFQASFTTATKKRLERAWEYNNISENDGWDTLAEKLVFDKNPLEIAKETIHGQYARVDAKAGAETRDYYLRKEDGRWKIELGAGIRYRREEAKAMKAEKSAAAEAEAAAQQKAFEEKMKR